MKCREHIYQYSLRVFVLTFERPGKRCVKSVKSGNRVVCVSFCSAFAQCRMQ